MNAPAPCRPPADLRFPICLDYGATTPVDPHVARVMCDFLTEKFGNAASSSHPFGWEARRAVDKARAQVAGLVGARPDEIIWTSGATESNNLALKGCAHALRAQGRGKHLITVATEHKAVLDTMHTLEKSGFEVTYLQPGADGLITPAQFRAALRPDTLLASVMYVNNEIGVIQPIAELGELCAERGVVFHVDAVQAAGKIAIDLQQLKVDLMSFSAHKVYGPKGIGALYVRHNPGRGVEGGVGGGGREDGRGGGTLGAHQIVGMGEACALAGDLLEEEGRRIRALRDRLWAGLADLPGVQLNGSAEARVPHNLNVSFPPTRYGTLGSQLLGIAVSAGSACNSAASAPSFVLLAIGRSPDVARNAVRFSLGRGTTEAEIDYVVATVRQVLAHEVETELLAAH